MSETQAKAGRKEWIGLAVLVLPCLLISMDISVLFLALPFISADLAPTATQQLWIMDSYGFVLAGMLITMGALGDRVGRRKLLLLGAGAFGVASVAAAYSGSADMLIATRAVLGLAGATLMPSTLALIRNMFHDDGQRKTAIAVWTSGMTSGAILGPVIGGFLLNHFAWGSVFLINVPAMLLLLVAGPILLPEFRTPAAGRFDLPSALLSLASVLSVIYGIKEMAVDGLRLVPALSVFAGLLLGVAFVRRQQVHPTPLLDVKLFGHRAFSSAVLVNVIGSFAFIGTSLFTNQYLQLVLGLRPLAAALWSLTVMPVIFVAMAISGMLAKKVRPSAVLGGGLLTMALGAGVLAQVHADSPLWLVLAGAAVVASGFLVSSMLTADLILGAAPPERAGAASALAETGSELGGALGLAILGSIGAAVYHHQMAGRGEASETLAGAAATAARTPGQAGTALFDAGRVAFTHGMNMAALSGGAVLAVAAVAVLVLLRGLRTKSSEADAREPAAV
jgi:DHA2 family multidrug resistance protein-like MFS transporter